MDEPPQWENNSWQECITAVFYEIQPMRPKDIKLCLKYYKNSGLQILSNFKFVFDTSFSLRPNIRLLIQWFGSANAFKLLVWVFVASIFGYFEFGFVFCMVSLIIALFTIGVSHEKKKPGELSAYSVFNEGFQTLVGTFTAEQFERDMRRDPNWRLNENNVVNNIFNQQNDENEIEQNVMVDENNIQEINIPQSRKRRAHQDRLRRRTQLNNQDLHNIVGVQDEEWEDIADFE